MNNHRSPFSFFFLATSVRFLLERFLLSSGTSCGYSWKHQSSIVDDFIFFFQTFLSYISKKKKKKKKLKLYSFSPIKNDSLKKFLPTIRPTNYRPTIENLEKFRSKRVFKIEEISRLSTECREIN